MGELSRSKGLCESPLTVLCRAPARNLVPALAGLLSDSSYGHLLLHLELSADPVSKTQHTGSE